MSRAHLRLKAEGSTHLPRTGWSRNLSGWKVSSASPGCYRCGRQIYLMDFYGFFGDIWYINRLRIMQTSPTISCPYEGQLHTVSTSALQVAEEWQSPQQTNPQCIQRWGVCKKKRGKTYESIEQWKKGPWLFGVNRGWQTPHLYRDYSINQYKDPH